MRKTLIWLAAAAILVAGGIVAYLFLLKAQRTPPPEISQQVALPPVPKPAPVAPVIRHPLESSPEKLPLPALEQSDAPLLKALSELLGDKWLALFFTDNVIHRVVATVDSLPRKYLPGGVMPLKRAPKAFVVTGKEDSLAISPRNAARYGRYIQLTRALDAKKLVALYVQFYPLFQHAYEELGYPKAYFNDRLVEAIDDLLAAPELKEPVALVQPGVLYEFADATLESRSAGQKIMIRMGRNNAVHVKAKLREIRKLVTGGSGPS
ncbi:MAG: DUF3014 domain-containing protein [Sulfuritalea sp.]|nr:DUF3014 domain-containing protein [Sulfuritalea sp.]